VLNYGHTFAHAFEALYGYGELLHGEAVALGMICASRLAERRGLVDGEVTQRQLRLLESLHLPTRLPQPITFSIDDVLQRMHLDKKTAAGRLRFILPTELGHVGLYSAVPEEDVRTILAGAIRSG
jgi:3-dehydroquinate synthase